MPDVNRHIVLAVVLIGGSGIVRAWTTNQGISRVVIGSYVLLLVLSLLDLLGKEGHQLASAFAMLATVYVVLTVFPWQEVIKATQGKK